MRFGGSAGTAGAGGRGAEIPMRSLSSHDSSMGTRTLQRQHSKRQDHTTGCWEEGGEPLLDRRGVVRFRRRRRQASQPSIARAPNKRSIGFNSHFERHPTPSLSACAYNCSRERCLPVRPRGTRNLGRRRLRSRAGLQPGNIPYLPT